MKVSGQIIAAVLSIALSGCYTINATFEFTRLYLSKRPVTEVLSDPAVAPAIKERLRFVGDVLSFAEQSGLKTKDSYSYFVSLDRGNVSYIVMAAQSDRLEEVTWWFPIVGDVPYLGYFDKKSRDAKAQELRSQGLDVHTSGASGFSSLGWFHDPIFSSMLVRDDGWLADLFFHELTHKTLWIKGDATFNENLAAFVAGVLTEEFLTQRRAKGALATYRKEKQDKYLFAQWLTSLRSNLENLYRPGAIRTPSEILARKKEIFATYSNQLRPKFEVADYVGNLEWNNATVLASRLYSPEIGTFERAFRCVGGKDIRLFLTRLETEASVAKDPFAGLESLCAPQQGGGP